MPNCELCGEPMPAGEEMFKYHGYSGPCPKPPLVKAKPEPMDNDALADIAAAEVLHTLEAAIQGRPTITIHHYDHAKRIVKAALLFHKSRLKS